MTREDEVDAYLAQVLGVEDAALARLRAAGVAAGLPDIAVSALQGRLLTLLVQLVGGGRVLEVGTLGGYAAACLARGGAHVDTLELDPHHADVAEAELARIGLADRVAVHRGRAADTLPTLTGPYDLVFVDADKQGNPGYVTAALPLCRPGALVIVDNVVRGGRVVDPTSTDPSVVGTRAVLALLADDPRLETATALQTVGAKGWDGFAIARVVAPAA